MASIITQPDNYSKNSKGIQVTGNSIEMEWLKKRCEKISSAAKAALITLSTLFLAAGIVFTAVSFHLLPLLWPIGLTVMGLGLALLLGYTYIKLERPFDPVIEPKFKKTEKILKSIPFLDYPSQPKEIAFSKKCLDKYGLDSPPKWNYYDKNAVTFTSATSNDKSDTPYGIIRKSPTIRYLTCEGGGSKGTAYASFVREIDKQISLLDGLEEVAGTSAGSLFAVLLAAGIHINKVDDLIAKTKIHEHLGDSTEECVLKEFKLHKWGGYYSATKIADFIHIQTRDSITNYYESLDEEKQKAMQKKFGEEFFTYKDGVTFKHLQWMHELDPKRFKRLHVVGFDRITKKPFYFNDKRTPDTKLFYAVRVSISIPFIFKPVLGADGTYFTDGGEISNMPSEIFTSHEKFNPAELIQLTFDRKGKAYSILHNTPLQGIVHTILSWTKQTLLGSHYTEALEKDKKKIYNMGPHTLVVPHGELNTLDFWAPQDILKTARSQAAKAGKKYGRILRTEAVHDRYKTVQDAASSLSKFEKLHVILSQEYRDAAKNPDLSKPPHQFYNFVKKFPSQQIA